MFVRRTGSAPKLAPFLKLNYTTVCDLGGHKNGCVRCPSPICIPGPQTGGVVVHMGNGAIYTSTVTESSWAYTILKNSGGEGGRMFLWILYT